MISSSLSNEEIFLSKEIKGTYNVGGPEKYSRYSAFQKITNGLDSNIKKHIKIRTGNKRRQVFNKRLFLW